MSESTITTAPRNGLGTAGLVLGIIAATVGFIPILGLLSFLLAPLAVILGAIGWTRTRGARPVADNPVAAMVGAGLGALGFVLAIAMAVMMSAMVEAAEGERAGVAPVAPVAASDGLLYEVESDGAAAMITYTVDDQFNIAQENGAVLPWSKTVDAGAGFLGGGGSLSAQADQSASTITCRVIRDGEVISENTSTGQFAVVTCSGF